MFKDKITKLTSGAVLLASVSSFTSSVQANPGSTLLNSRKIAKELQNSSFFRKSPVLWSMIIAFAVLGISYALILLDKWVKLRSLEKEQCEIGTFSDILSVYPKDIEELEDKQKKLLADITKNDEKTALLKKSISEKEILIKTTDERIQKLDKFREEWNNKFKDIEKEALCLYNITEYKQKSGVLKENEEEFENKKQNFEKDLLELKGLSKKDYEDIHGGCKEKEYKDKLLVLLNNINTFEDLVRKKEEVFSYYNEYVCTFETFGVGKLLNYLGKKSGTYSKKYFKLRNFCYLLGLKGKIDALKTVMVNLEKQYSKELLTSEESSSKCVEGLKQIVGSLLDIVVNEEDKKAVQNDALKLFFEGFDSSKFYSNNLVSLNKKLTNQINNIKSKIEKEKECLKVKLDESKAEKMKIEESIRILNRKANEVGNSVSAKKSRLEEVKEKVKNRYGSKTLMFQKENSISYARKAVKKGFWYPNSFPGQHSLFS